MYMVYKYIAHILYYIYNTDGVTELVYGVSKIVFLALRKILGKWCRFKEEVHSNEYVCDERTYNTINKYCLDGFFTVRQSTYCTIYTV